MTFDRQQLARVEPSLDLLVLKLAGQAGKKSELLLVSIGRGPFVKAGDRVLAIGFNVNEPNRATSRSTVTYREELVGSVANVIETKPNWDQETGVGPTFVVDGYWPKGMSGSPVFNESGIVVGVVSKGGPSWSSALWLQALPFDEKIFPGLDGNPGWAKDGPLRTPIS